MKIDELTYRQAIKNYTDADGLVCHVEVKKDERGASGNGILYTSLHLIALQLNGWINEFDRKDYLKTISKCEVIQHSWCLKRSPIKDDLNSFDDYIGLSSCLYLCNLPFSAKSFLRKMKEVNFVCNNEQYNKFTFRSWLGRNPKFVAHVYNCGGEKPSLFHGFYQDMSFRASALFNSKTADDGNMLTMLMAICSKTKSAKYYIDKYNWNFSFDHYGFVARALHKDDHPLSMAFRNLAY